MKPIRSLFPMLLAAVLAVLAGCGPQKASFDRLLCEYLADPLGIDVPAPRFTWSYGSEADFRQARFQVIVAGDPGRLDDKRGDVWISPVMEGPASSLRYGGETALQSYTPYFWKVIAWDERGKRYDSPAARFETAKMGSGEWTARWISDGQDQAAQAAPLFRKTFSAGKAVRQARLYVTGLGYYEIRLNDRRVGDRFLDPGFTSFDRRVLYATYDVTEMIDAGENVISAALGNGWLNNQVVCVWLFEQARWRQRPLMICELHMDYTDGTREVIVSDASWKTNTGACVSNSLYSGDVYDARYEEKGWRLPGFDDAHWKQAVLREAPAPVLESELFPPIRITQILNPVSVKTFGGKDHTLVFDLGYNISGFCRLKVKGEAGTRVQLRHTERAFPDGRADRGTTEEFFHGGPGGRIKPADRPFIPDEQFQTDVYYLRGDPQGEAFTPAFTYHGFRYVEVESSAPIVVEELEGLFLHTDLEPAGRFSCSNELLNKLWDATNRSYLGNLHSIPTDCPTREKNGWTADAWMAVDLGLLNFDGIKFYEKWMTDWIDNQRPEGDFSGVIPSVWDDEWVGPVWDAGMFIIPRALYDYYGDAQTIERVFPMCEKYLAYLLTREGKDGLVTHGIGDWIPFKTVTPTEFTTACFYYYDYRAMADFAQILGRDPAPYRIKAEVIRRAVNQRFFDPANARYANGSMAAQAVPLWLGLVPSEYEQPVADRLVKLVRDNHHLVDFGMLGSKAVPRMLTQYGYVGDAYKLVAATGFPSWGYWIEQWGMTTLSEQWGGGHSYNHVFLGDISAWMYNTLAGINFDPEKPGFEHFRIQPHFIGELDWVKAEYRSVKGMIRSEWKRIDGGIELTVTVPANTTATVVTDRGTTVGGGVHTFRVAL